MISADALFTRQYADHRERDGHVPVRAIRSADRAAEDLVQHARCLYRRNDGDNVDERSPGPMLVAVESVRPCMTAPAAATTIVACGPRSSSAVKSITKDGGMVAQSFAVECCTASDAVSIAARIKLENTRVRSGSGQPAKPKYTPATMANSANATTTRRRERGSAFQGGRRRRLRRTDPKLTKQCDGQLGRSRQISTDNRLRESACVRRLGLVLHFGTRSNRTCSVQEHAGF